MSRLAFLIVFVIFALSGCAAPAPYNPFKIPQDEFFSNTRTIVMSSLAIPRDISDSEQVKTKFESLIEKKLQEAGYTVIPSAAMDEVWRRKLEQSGGVFDPITGKRDESKYKLAVEQARRELCSYYHADALLFPSIKTYSIHWAGWTANWDGTSEDLKSTGRKIAEVIGGVASNGTVPVLSLRIVMQNSNGVPVYIKNGGIQLLSKISGSGFARVPKEQLFAEEERNAKAVDIALGPLMNRMDSSGKPATTQ